MKSTHKWKFFRAGGFDQVQLDTGADLLALDQLDQKLWVALSCPTRGIEFDSRTLDMIDADHDGQVRANEILAAVQWAGVLLKNGELLANGSDTLMLSDINDSIEEGRQILASARHILKSLGKQDANAISLDDLADIEKFLAGLQFNGDGIICPNQVEDAVLRSTVEDIGKTVGTVKDVSGEDGISQEIADKFFTEAKAYVEWYATGEADPDILKLGTNRQAAAAALESVKGKINDYFLRCGMAEYDARASSPLSRSIEDYQRIAHQDLSAEIAEVASFPLAIIGPDKPLPLASGVNPAWQDKIAMLREFVVKPLHGDSVSLTQADWHGLCAKFSAYEVWQGTEPASAVNALGIERLRQTLLGNEQAEISGLIGKDKAVESEVNSIRSVERLIRYRRDLFRLANNFVSFREFYSGRQKSIFQMGTLYLDGRSCDLCIRVDDVNAHAAYANSSGVCLAYCELVRNGGAGKMNIAAAFTAGDSDFLMVGRNGVFYDRKGQDWNATIVRIADHPISIRQAFWSPYKKLIKAVSEQMQKFAASKANTVQEKVVKTVLESGGNAVAAAPGVPPKAAFDVAKFAGIFAAIGLAIGAIGGILASIVSGVFSLKAWQIPLAFAGLMLAISGPSMVLAWFKLKRRNLGPILDACGWAINARARINIPFGTSLTALPRLPEGAHRSLVDPYADKKPIWPYVLLVLLVVALIAWIWHQGHLS